MIELDWSDVRPITFNERIPTRAEEWLKTGRLSPNLSISELESVKAQIISAMQWHLTELDRRIAECAEH
jgi:hypothetical protein